MPVGERRGKLLKTGRRERASERDVVCFLVVVFHCEVYLIRNRVGFIDKLCVS